jgi:predicted nucleotidyltransferase component of viral defense system/DNA-directed RNA polymerase subunit RPC12/RpoP
MISRDEIMSVADQLGLRPQVVEKDYVLGWLLAGIEQDPLLKEAWVFKGGTCLKKCYFETYRFSEDLDFTISDPTHIDEPFLRSRFETLSEWLYDETGIEVPKDKISFDVWDTKRGSRAGQGKITYRGPIAPNNKDLPRIKLDLTADEKLVLPKTTRPVIFPYSDNPDGGIHAQCYSYEEVFGEKVRALTERTRPRDLYDVINLFRHEEFDVSPAVIRDVIKQKCNFKQIDFPTLQALQSHKDELFADWQNMLAHQLPQLPPVESFWSALDEFFDWLNDRSTRTALGSQPSPSGADLVRLPVGGIRIPGRSSAFIEVIRFAAANHLCVELDYTNQKGERRPRTVEAYSLRRTKDGHLLLMAVEADTGASKSYRIDQIHGAKMVNRSFTPRYQIELTPTTPIIAPSLTRSTLSSGSISRPTRQKASRWGSKLVHTYRCSICGKKFERMTRDSKLREHKNKYGFRCSGRTGIYEGANYK